MAENILSFENVNIIKAPGFTPPGFMVENLNPGINLIYGPNAAGKTTLARAFNYLLWPGQFFTDRINIEGNFKFNGSNW
ncbi:MAG: ATP-binding protein, partial [Bacillota bacterium]